MARPGRELEQIVATVEAALSGTGVEVRSPYHVAGRSGLRREVDVWITGHLGSAPITVMVECRDRQDVQDVTWIDEVAGKADDVGADKVIAVSAEGFSEGARQSAAARGVEIRTLEDLAPADVLGWLGVSEILILSPDAEMVMGVEVYGDPAWEATPEWRNFDIPQELVLETPSGERRVSPAEAWRRVADDQVWDGVPTDGSRQSLGAVFLMRGPENMRLVVETPFGRALVRTLRFDGELWFEREVVPVERATRYLGPEGVIARSAHFGFEEGDQRLRVTLHVIEEGHFTITIHPVEG